MMIFKSQLEVYRVAAAAFMFDLAGTRSARPRAGAGPTGSVTQPASEARAAVRARRQREEIRLRRPGGEAIVTVTRDSDRA